MRILVIEDEPQLANQVARALIRENHSAEIVADGAEGLAAAKRGHFDLIVLDVNLPTMDGFTLLRRLRETHLKTRVLLLTARTDVEDRVAGLKAGADDYLSKPFAIEELLARVEAVGRRAFTSAPDTSLEFADLHMDVVHRKLFRKGQLVALSPREFEVLQILMREPGRVFSREEISERIWEREYEYDTRTVEIFVMRLRRKLDEGRSQPLIRTVRGVGYGLCPQQ
jgi:DNA-binding response OmpR family regulator